MLATVDVFWERQEETGLKNLGDFSFFVNYHYYKLIVHQDSQSKTL